MAELGIGELQRRAAAILAPVAHPRALAALALVEEAGEVARVVLDREGYGQPLDPARLGGELADLVIAAAELACRYGIDLEAACRDKLEDIARRCPEWERRYGTALAAARARMDA